MVVLVAVSAASPVDAVYLQEGFNGTSLPSGWSQRRITGTQAAWSVVAQGTNPTVSPYAGTGMAKFNSFDASAGEQARLTSPAINLTSASDPFLSFWMYHEDEYLEALDSVYVEASTADSIVGPWTLLAGVRRPRATNQWMKEVISLYPYRGANRLFLSLRGVSKYGNNIFVDEFRVADSSFHDIGMVGLLYSGPQFAPATPQPLPAATGSRITSKTERTTATDRRLILHNAAPLTLGAIVRNFGTFAENAYSVAWRIDGQQQSSVAGRPLAARIGLDTLALTWQSPTAGLHTVTAWTVLSTDSTRTNDTTALLMHVLDTATVFYESFNGPSFPPPNWIAINRDGGALQPWFAGADTSAFVPFEGRGFAANNFQRANNHYLDDYLITPPVAGVAQAGKADSLIFWTRSKFNSPPLQNYPDSLMLLLSTSGADTSNFTSVIDYFAVPKGGWTRMAYSLSNRVSPNSTVRVAFRYLLFNVLPTGGSGDFVGIDAVQFVRRAPTSVSHARLLPKTFSVEQNYPNPFNPTTTIRISLPEASFVSLRILDLLGRQVSELHAGQMSAGYQEVKWNGTDASGMQVASGVYICRMEARQPGGSSFIGARTMILLK
jgi:hypothetical protein